MGNVAEYDAVGRREKERKHDCVKEFIVEEGKRKKEKKIN